ncbi:site-specific integrase [Flavobacterium sp. 102]|uniref:site-specific integrase n=1 Tax=Flavobacterium sp. 102 TaxID=2135623 RepID=UPI000EB2F612|nr:site-specific integrase [Flavobacterium sp. 102]RKS01442.1 site-specific recombinase XerD [Flavobacterium sp. 102]
MINNNLKILFLLDKVKTNKQGNAPIRCRLTFNKKRKIFSTGLFINPRYWYSESQIAKPPNDDNIYINTQLSLIKQKVNQAFLFLQVNNADFTLDDLFSQYKGVPTQKEMALVEVYNLYLQRIKRLIDKEIKLVTYKKYEESLTHLKDFIRWKFKASDIKISALKSSFITEYEYFLKVEKNLQISTLNKAIQRFRKVLFYAISQNHLDKDPFMFYKAKRLKKEVVYLDNVELEKLENHLFEIKRVKQIKDLFIFCCYTGLGFTEMRNLKTSDIVEGFDSELWIDIKRNKTQRSYRVPLLKKAKSIIDIYQSDSNEFVFPRMSNPKFNAYLKEIANIVGIEKNLTHHIARKTFASTVLLFNDVPMEIVSELLGHSKMSTTQEYYAKVVNKKVSQEMIRLASKINK